MKNRRTLSATLVTFLLAFIFVGLAPAQSVAPTVPITPKVMGMSAPASNWNTRLSEVGACGVEARRIFASLSSDGRNQSNLIQQAVNAGMMPVVSYKAPSASGAASGQYDSMMSAVGTYLASLGVQVTATYWHEPHGDMTASQFRAGSRRFLDRVQSTNVDVGPLLNGWLLDRQKATFAGYTDASLLRDWRWVGVDSYQSKAGAPYGGRALPLLETWMDSVGQPDKPLGLGEYNGWDASSVDLGGDQIRTIPEVWFGLVWNSSGGLGTPLTGTRLAEFKEDKAAPEVKKDGGC